MLGLSSVTSAFSCQIESLLQLLFIYLCVEISDEPVPGIIMQSSFAPSKDVTQNCLPLKRTSKLDLAQSMVPHGSCLMKFFSHLQFEYLWIYSAKNYFNYLTLPISWEISAPSSMMLKVLIFYFLKAFLSNKQCFRSNIVDCFVPTLTLIYAIYSRTFPTKSNAVFYFPLSFGFIF